MPDIINYKLEESEYRRPNTYRFVVRFVHFDGKLAKQYTLKLLRNKMADGHFQPTFLMVG